MDAIIVAIQDVIKLKLVNLFKGEDPYYSNTMIFAYMTIVSALFLMIKSFINGDISYIKQLYRFYYIVFVSWRDPMGVKFNPKYVHNTQQNTNNSSTTTTNSMNSMNSMGSMSTSLSQFLLSEDYYKKAILLWTLHYFPNNENFVNKVSLVFTHNKKYMMTKININNDEDIKKIKLIDYDFIKEIPIFYHKGEVIYLSTDTNPWLLLHNSQVVLRKFFANLEKFIETNKLNINITNPATNKLCNIYSVTNEGHVYPEAVINENKIFDNMVLGNKEYYLKILDEFKSKQTSKNPYDNKNLGILLFGPAGTGKTNFIKAVCNYLKKHAVVVDMRKVNTLSMLKKIFCININDSIFVFDELDHLISSVVTKKQSNQNKHTNLQLQILLQSIAEAKTADEKKKLKDEYTQLLTSDMDNIDYYSLLTLLDGMIEYSGRVIIATTNNIDQIPPELKRPGRFDHVIHLDKFVNNEIKELLYKLYGRNTQYTFPDRVWTPAEIINIYNSGSTFEQTINILLKEK